MSYYIMKVKPIMQWKVKEKSLHLKVKKRGLCEGGVDTQLCYTEGSLFLAGPFKKTIHGPKTAHLCLLPSPRQIRDNIFTTRSEEPTSS